MVGKIKAFIKSIVSSQETTAQRLVQANALNRRRNTRIQYSHIGAVGDLPRVFYGADEMVVGNISTGGLLIIDDNEKLGHQAGEITTVRLIWSNLTVSTKAKVVGAQFQRRHVQFVDFNPAAFVRISKLIKPGFLGSRFRCVKDDAQLLTSPEVWIGPAGESLTFPRSDQSATPEVIFFDGQRSMRLKPYAWPEAMEGGQPLSESNVSDLMITLANFPQPTLRIKTLIEDLHEVYLERQRLTAKTGS
jgi:hypothetical protein